MKVNYDSMPSVLEAVGNGSYRYHYDIKEVENEQNHTDVDAQNEEGSIEKKTHWECQEAIVWEPLTSNGITEAVISDKWDGNKEQKLVNEYNAVQLGVITDKVEIAIRTEAYKDFLVERARLKEQVDADCKMLGIK